MLLAVISAVLSVVMVSSIRDSNFLRKRKKVCSQELEKYPQTKSEETRTVGFTALPHPTLY